MMLCVISYWVLSGAKRRQIQQLRCCILPTKLLKRRDVYLKLTRHNGRAGTHGTYNPKHNDRSFNLANSEHIDPERAMATSTGLLSRLWFGSRSIRPGRFGCDLLGRGTAVLREPLHGLCWKVRTSATPRSGTRNATAPFPDLLSSRKTCRKKPSTSLGLDEHASAEDLLNIVTEFIEVFKTKFGEHVHVLDWALHLDESTPHIHERHVFDCENRYGDGTPAGKGTGRWVSTCPIRTSPQPPEQPQNHL